MKLKKIANGVKSRLKKRLEPTKDKWSKKRLGEALRRGYLNDHGRPLNLENPNLFTEKLQWYKINYRTTDMCLAVDKYDFKGYISKKLGDGYTIPCFGAWDSIASLKKAWADLPETFILKSTLQSDGRNIKVIKNKSQIDFADLSRELKLWLKKENTLINSYCRAYHLSKPRILAEEYVEWIGDQLFDYKFFCFSGEPFCAYAAMDHFKNGENSNDYPISFYDMQWNRLDVKYGKHQNGEIPPPKHLEEMKKISEILSRDFPFVRVDFFDTEDALYLAELTFYPGGGNTEYDPVAFDESLGEKFILPKANI